MPVAFPAQPCKNSVISRSTEFNQFANAFLASAPLFQVAHADTPSKPMIEFNDIVIFHSDPEVIHPSLSIGTDFPVPVIHGDAPTAASKMAQFGLEPRNGFLGDSKPFTGEGKPEKGTFLGLHHFAFVPVDLYLEDFLKKSAYTFHHTESGSSGLHEDNRESRPAELPRQSLAEPDVNLAAHPAPIIQSETTSQASNARTIRECVCTRFRDVAAHCRHVLPVSCISFLPIE